MKLKKIFAEIFGWYGAIAVAYALNSLLIIQANSWAYQILNFTGSLGLIVIAFTKKVYQSVFINVVWIIIALIGIIY